MRVAIDKNCINQIKDFTEFEYIYVFEDEPIEKLLKLKINCINKKYAEGIDVNLTNYDIPCRVKSKYENNDWRELEEKQYKFAIIVPNCNNDHRRI